MNQPDVTVVLPVFNRARTVLDTLDGVLAQTVRPTRLVVVDDGSTDDTASSVRQWLERHYEGSGTLLQQPNSGAAAARNSGLAMVTDSPFIAFLDSDDTWPVDFVERTSRMLREDQTAVSVSCDRKYVSADGEAADVERMSQLAANPTQWLFAHGAGVLSCSLLRADVVQSLGGFDAGLPTGHDSAMLLPLSTRGAWLHCPGDPVTYGRGLAAARGEEDHVHKASPDFALRWATIHEDFVRSGGGAEALPQGFYRRELAGRWSHAARQLLVAGHVTEARKCFRRSVSWRYRTKTLWQLGLTYVNFGKGRTHHRQRTTQ